MHTPSIYHGRLKGLIWTLDRVNLTVCLAPTKYVAEPKHLSCQLSTENSYCFCIFLIEIDGPNLSKSVKTDTYMWFVHGVRSIYPVMA